VTAPHAAMPPAIKDPMVVDIVPAVQLPVAKESVGCYTRARALRSDVCDKERRSKTSIAYTEREVAWSQQLNSRRLG
jgi:hypothetical protein